MVSIEGRIAYLSRIQDDNILRLFYSFLQSKKLQIELNDFQNQTDKDLALLVESLILNKKDDFISLHNQFSQKKPSVTSPWVNNDYLIFVLITGICLFGISKEWITSVLNVRKTQEITQQQINTTLKNIVTDNLKSNDNLLELIVVFQSLQHQSLFEDKTNELYTKIVNDKYLFEKRQDFLTCLSLRALDIIVCSKGFVDIEENDKLQRFSETFIKRTRIIGTGFYWLIIGCLILCAIYFYIKNEAAFNTVTNIFGFLGIGLSGLFKYIPPILIKGLRGTFGYSILDKKQ